MAWRIAVALVLAALVAVLGALILGEYEFEGTLPWIAGPLFGLVLGELVVSVGRSRSLIVAVLTAGMAAGGIVWAGWIDAGEGLEPLKDLVWVSALLAGLTAMVRTAGFSRS